MEIQIKTLTTTKWSPIVSAADQSTPSIFEFDLAVFRLAAIKKAAYRFSGQFDIRFESVDESRIRVILAPITGHAGNSLVAGTFPNEVLDQDLRELVAEETRSVRELLLAQAFSGISVIDAAGENADYRDDPLGIANPSRTERSTDERQQSG